MHFVYILYSQQLDRFYVGESANPDERLQHHRAGHQRYTRRAADWVRVFLKTVETREEALDIEQRIKQAHNRNTVLRWIHGSDNQMPEDAWISFSW